MKKILFITLLTACTVDIEPYKQVEVQKAKDLDILFVIDDSSDRARYDQMASQIGTLQAQLATIDGELPSLHVGVVTTDLGTDSTQDFPVPSVGNCVGEGRGAKLQTFDASLGDDFLRDLRGSDGSRIRNYESGDLALELGKLTNPAPGMADSGCEFEQPLEAMRRALDPETNPGFVRANAALSIVFLTNEDDCSLASGAMLDPWTQGSALGPLTSFRCTEYGVECSFPSDPRQPGEHGSCKPREGSPYMVDVSEYKTFLEGYKADKRDIVVSAVAGPTTDKIVVGDVGVPVLNPSCSGPGGNAYPAVRLASLVSAFGGVMVDSCTQQAAYEQLTMPIVGGQRSCFPTLTKADGDDCQVMEIAGDTETELAKCDDGSAGPCWYKLEDKLACPDGDNLAIAIKRGATPTPIASRIEARCFVK